MQDTKMVDQIAGLENDGPWIMMDPIAGLEHEAPAKWRIKSQRLKMTDVEKGRTESHTPVAYSTVSRNKYDTTCGLSVGFGGRTG